MNTKKYLIDTYCEHGDDKFGFIVQLTEYQAMKVRELGIRDNEVWVTIEETDLTPKDVELVNKFTHEYMPRLSFRKPPTDKYLDDALANTDEHFIPFYRGKGLEKL